MKLTKHIAGVLGATALAMGAWSCTDLDEVTYDRIDASKYYQDANAVKGAVASIYQSAINGFLEYFWYLNEFSADQVAWRTWNGGLWGYDEAAKYVLSTQTWNSEAVIIRQAWEHAWETIGLCNNVLNDLGQLDAASIGLTDAELASYIGEVRTMRAWSYYQNFELWGGALPLNTEVTTVIPGSVSTNFNEGCQIIWDFIANELDACYADMLVETGSNATRTRLNQGMNRMLKMRLLLNSEVWTGVPRYTECATLAREILAGDYGTYQLASDYRDIFSTTNYSCPEIVFGFQMEDGHMTDNFRSIPYYPYNYDEIFGCDTYSQSGWNCTCLAPSQDNTGTVIDNMRSEGSQSFIFHYGDKLGAPFDRFNDYDIRKQPFTSDAAGNYQGMFLMGAQYNYITGEAVLADADLDGQPLYYTDQVGTFSNQGRQLEPVMGPRWGMTNSGYRLVKYPLQPSTSGSIWVNAAEVEFRLAEVYYTLAECALRAGNANDAKQYVNQVRQRYYDSANLAQIENPGPGFTSFDLDWMLSEWGLEFLDESRRRRTDLRRFDKFTQGQWWFFGRATETDRNMPATRDRKYEWYPLPQVALMVNPGLVQNPNY